MTPDHPLVRITGRCAALAGVVFLASVPVYVYVEPAWRPLVARLAGAFVLGVALVQLRRALAEMFEERGASALDAARVRRPPEPAVPYHFLELVGDVRAALRSRRHFDKVLWPRLVALAALPPARPKLRRGLGPSLDSLRGVIDAIEKRP